MNTFLRGIRVFFLFVCFISVSNMTYAYDVSGNHTGSYLYGMFGMGLIDHDTNARTGLEFGDDIEFGYGFTYGHNITNWLSPEFQFSYITATGNTPGGPAREHALTVRINARYSFLTKSQLEKSGKWKFYPYVKAGGLAHGLYVNAPVIDDKVGAWGGGFALGGGLEVNYKALYLGLDVSNDFVFLQGQSRVIAGTSTVILNSGLDYQMAVMACLGVHF